MSKTTAATPLDIAEVPFSDLILLLSRKAPDDDRIRRVLTTVGTELGRGGSGLLAIADVPRAGALRRRLLPMAQRLALMDHPTRMQLLKVPACKDPYLDLIVWHRPLFSQLRFSSFSFFFSRKLQCRYVFISFNWWLQKHGLGSDVPLKKLDRSVSSFAKLLRHSGELQLLESLNGTECPNSQPFFLEKAHAVDGSDESDCDDDDIEILGELVEELGLHMMELGILVARACDIVIGGGQLEQSITDFGTAKARLIHYHSHLDNIVIKESSTNRKLSVNKVSGKHCSSLSQRRSGSPDGDDINSEVETAVPEKIHNGSKDTTTEDCADAICLQNLWQEWHYDYGIFTVLTAPLFLRTSIAEECLVGQEFHLPDGHTHLHLCNRRKLFAVRCSPDSFIVQVGEAADILSGGKLRSTLHAVSRPSSLSNISRETFVVFLQPSWDKTFTYAGYSIDSEDEFNGDTEMATRSNDSDQLCHKNQYMQEIMKKIPPLSSRLKEGMTFAEFSRQTTKQYYGGSGIQQNN